MKNFWIGVLIMAAMMALNAHAKPLKVLMVGNSFSLSCRHYLPKVAASVPGCDLQLEIAYIGGCSLQRHIEEFNHSAQDPEHRPYTDVQDQRATLQMLLHRERWDVISIQQASHESWRAESYQPWADQLIKIIRDSNPQAEIIIQETWSYNAGDPRIHDENGAWHLTQQTMYEKLAANYRNLAKAKKFRMVPVGLAVQYSREDNPVQLPVITLADFGKYTLETVPPTQDMTGGAYQRTDAPGIRVDMIHLNSYGDYMQACVWFGFLFKRNVADIPFYPEELPDRARLDKARICAQKALDNCPEAHYAPGTKTCMEPKAVQAELQKALPRLQTIPRTPRTVTFSIISDLHTINFDRNTASPGNRNTFPVIGYSHAADALAHFDFLADLGDTGLELPDFNTPQAGDDLLKRYAAEHLKSAKVTLICMGNHDTDAGRITPAQFGEVMNRPQAKRAKIVFGADASYGYYDLPKQRVRVFFLNTGRNYESTQAQNDFVKAKLAELSGDWIAIYLMHFCPDPAGRWVAPWSPKEWKLNPLMQELVNIIANSERSAAVFCGDSHFDADFKLGKVPGFVTQGYGGINPAWMPEGARRNEVDAMHNFLMEWVVLTPETREVKVIRAGVGGANADRAAKF